MKPLAVALLLFLVSCGPSDPSRQDILDAWAVQGQTGGTMLIGDSITARWPQDLAPAGSYNRGIDGDTTTGVVKRFWLVQQEEPETVYLMIGINNFVTGEPILSDIGWMLDQLSGCDVYLLGLLPCDCSRVDREVAAAVNAELEVLALDRDNVTFVDLGELFLLDGAVVNTTDGVHPNRTGYSLMQEALR